MTPVEERIDHEAETREIAESVVRTAEEWNYDGKPVHYATFRLWIDYAARIARAYLDRLTEHSAREQESNAYRIEADCAMRDYDGLELDAGIMLAALIAIEQGRPNKAFDPWARQEARRALEAISDRAKAIALPAAESAQPEEERHG